MSADFIQAQHTIVVSDIHLADAEPPHPHNPLWKRFKRPAHFVDRTFKAFLEHVDANVPGPVELVFNGDIFDFDSVMALPTEGSLSISWLERKRGLATEEAKSRFKIGAILKDHAIWTDALRKFVLSGHRMVFVIGNHDMELHWPQVRQDLIDHLGLPEDARERVRFCEWFYVSNGDTLIEHGNQYDAYSLSANPINPLIRKGSRVYVRTPFGNLAGKYMLNGMGLMNPHANSSYIKSSFMEYLVFYYKYVMRSQPLLLWTYFWSALVTLVYSITDGWLPAMTDPLTVDSRVSEIAKRANSSPRVVWSLKELHVHPAIFDPVKVARELWLDRLLLLGFIVFFSFQVFSTLNVFVSLSVWWFIVTVLILMPMFIFYARSVTSDVEETQHNAFRLTPVSARIAGVWRVVQGHTHIEQHTWIAGVEYLNTGTWSPAYRDVECTQPYGRKCFAWIKPRVAGQAPESVPPASASGEGDPRGNEGRVAELYEWKDGELTLVKAEKDSPPPTLG